MKTPDREEDIAVRTDDVGGLVLAAARGDATSWRALVERFSGLVWSVARGYGLANADAEEVYQTTWLRFAEHVGRLKEPDRAGAWLATTARHECFRLSRARTRVDLTDDLDGLAPQVDERSPETAVVESEETAAELERLRGLWESFHELPARCLRLLRALLASPPPSYAEIAVAFEIPIGSIGPTRARCLGRLRDLLAERGIHGEAGHRRG
jgi:RNA polymerase sigma factor (sigma-70 family)